MTSSDRISDHRRYRKQCLCNLLGGKCQICGFSDYIEALEFHHVDPSSKKYSQSSGNCHSVQEDVDEARKCILLCANCHRGIHANKLQIPPPPYPFDEDYTRILVEASHKYIRVESYLNRNDHVCPKCGKALSRKATVCKECQKSQNVPRPDRQTLAELIVSESFCDIGRKYGVSDNSVRKWCKNFGQPYRKRDILT